MIWCLYFTPCSTVSFVNFEQVNASWVLCRILGSISYTVTPLRTEYAPCWGDMIQLTRLVDKTYLNFTKVIHYRQTWKIRFKNRASSCWFSSSSGQKMINITYIEQKRLSHFVCTLSFVFHGVSLEKNFFF